MILSRDKALDALRAVAVFTKDVEDRLSVWQWTEEQYSVLQELELLQRVNMQVFPLLREVVKSPTAWDDLKVPVHQFLLQECEQEKLIARKLAWLGSVNIPLSSLQYVYQNLLSGLQEDYEVPFLWSDLYAFTGMDPASIPTLRSIYDPVVEGYKERHQLKIILRISDSLGLYSEGSNRIQMLLSFAEDLRQAVLEARKTMGLPNVVNIAFGIAYDRCKFNLLTREPEPSEACAWTQAARLMSKAERICKYQHEQGGVILVSDKVVDIITETQETGSDKFERVNMATIHSQLEDLDVNFFRG